MNTLLKIQMLRGSRYKEKLARRQLRDVSDCITLPDAYLMKNCGVNRTVYHQILRILEPVVPRTRRSNGIPFPLKVLVTLSFLASGLHQKSIGQDFNVNISQKSVSRVIKSVVEGLNAVLNDWIVFPAILAHRQHIKEGWVKDYNFSSYFFAGMGMGGKLAEAVGDKAVSEWWPRKGCRLVGRPPDRWSNDIVKKEAGRLWMHIPQDFYPALRGCGFYRKYHFPETIGCLDGTYIQIVCPRDDVEAFYDRKEQYSIHAQLICDADTRIIAVCCKFGGSANNAYIWNKMQIRPFIENISRQGETSWLIADNKYPQRAWLMTPILHVTPGTPDSQYNHFHGRTKTCIDRCIAKLKGRWQCLHKRPLHYTPQRSAKIINACAVLHNFCISADLPDPEPYLDPEPTLNVNEITEMPDDNVNDLYIGMEVRQQLSERIYYSV